MTEHAHLTLDMLGDYLDRILSPEEYELVEKHLESCSACRHERSRLEGVLRGSAALPRSVLPPDDIWPDIRAEIERRKNVVLPVGIGASGSRRTADDNTRRDRLVKLVAAAVLLIAASSGITVLATRGPNGLGSTGSGSIGGAGAAVSAPVLPAGFVTTEAEYIRTIDDLRNTFEDHREHLQPETVRTVERSLAVIDTAIAEARAALVADPGNVTIGDLLVATYRRKLDLLRRTSELTSRL